MTSISFSRLGALPRASRMAIALSLVLNAHTALADDAATVVITAARQAQPVSDVLADTVVLTAEDIARAGSQTLVELLQQQRGIEVTRNGGAGSTASIFIRGTSNAQNVVLVDGVRIGSSTLGGASWETIPLSQIERVEIVYGPLSSLYGADAVGGVVQIFTKAANAPFAANASAGVGSYGLRKIAASVSGKNESGLSYAFSAGHEENTGFSATKASAPSWLYNQDVDGYAQDSVNTKLAYRIAADHTLRLQFVRSHLDAQFDAGPGYDDRSLQTLSTLSVTSENRFLPNWSSKMQLAQSKDENFSDASYGTGRYDTRQTQLSWQNDISLGKQALQLLAERREEKVDSSEPALIGQRNTNSLAAAWQYREDAHLLHASLRNDRSNQFGSNTTGNLGYGYRLDQNWRLQASVGTSFRAPTFNDLYFPYYGNVAIQPEHGKNGEIGATYRVGDTNFHATYYRNRVTDLIVYAYPCPSAPASGSGCAYNVNRATLSGLSMGFATTLSGVRINGSLDLQDPHDDTADRQLARRAKQHGALSAEYTVANIVLGAETVFSGKRFDDAANKVALPGYALLNLSARYSLCKGVDLLAHWNNVLNKDYELAKNYATAGSNIFAGVNAHY